MPIGQDAPTHAAFLAVIRPLIVECYPDEIDAFDVGAESILAGTSATDGKGAFNPFIAELGTSLMFVSFLAGTYASFKKVSQAPAGALDGQAAITSALQERLNGGKQTVDRGKVAVLVESVSKGLASLVKGGS
jgi:hypothetical protein